MPLRQYKKVVHVKFIFKTSKLDEFEFGFSPRFSKGFSNTPMLLIIYHRASLGAATDNLGDVKKMKGLCLTE